MQLIVLSKTQHKDERGTALVEFVIVFPVLLVMLFGIIQVGLLMTHKQTLTHAAREAARYGAITNSDDAMQAAAAEVLGGLSDETEISIEPEESDRTSGDSARGEELTVSLIYSMNFLIPGVQREIELSSQASAFIECDDTTCATISE